MYLPRILKSKILSIFLPVIVTVFAINGSSIWSSTVSHAQGLAGNPASIIAAGAAVCASPPANFNPLKASNDELLFYGLPKKDPQHLNHWLEIATHAKYRGCNFITTKSPLRKLKSPITPKSTTSTTKPFTTQEYDYSHTWSGYVVGDGSPNGFNGIEADWHNPCINSSKTPTGSQLAMWVGIGGWKNDNSRYSGDLWQAGTELETGGSSGSGSPSHPVYHMWFETYPTQNWVVDSRNLSCGDWIEGEVDYNFTVPGDNYYSVYDLTNAEYISDYIVPGALQIPDATYAEVIDERPSCSLSNDYHQLTDFNYMSWSNIVVRPTTRGWGSFNAYYNSQATMDEARSPFADLTSVGNIGSDGKSFRDNFANNGNGNDNSC
jgi:Peptidase A4 family